MSTSRFHNYVKCPSINIIKWVDHLILNQKRKIENYISIYNIIKILEKTQQNYEKPHQNYAKWIGGDGIDNIEEKQNYLR